MITDASRSIFVIPINLPMIYSLFSSSESAIPPARALPILTAKVPTVPINAPSSDIKVIFKAFVAICKSLLLKISIIDCPTRLQLFTNSSNIS